MQSFDPLRKVSLPAAAVSLLLVAACATSTGRAPVENRDVFASGRPVVVSQGLPIAPAPQAGSPPLVALAPAPVTPPEAVPREQVETAPVRTGSVESRPLEAAAAPDVTAAAEPKARAENSPISVTREAAPVEQSPPPQAENKPVPADTKAAPAAPIAPTAPVAAAKGADPEQVALAPPGTETTPDKPSLTPAPAKPAAAKGTDRSVFIWPASGALVQSFTDAKSMGIGISGRAGDPVAAAADGKVIFSGLGPRGYGKLLIVKHTGELLSVYAHNQNLLVKEGQAVRQGQKIAELGSTGTDRPKLHFEIRRQGKPVDPLAYLPAQ